ncbi:ABC transporter permease [Nocardioides sp. HDW12B]|uniref:ABC transporter permease n=1 Tax=Nocardioides sp. HDW12B TaxID=2714939 RepID=UPI00140D0B1E|nr:ABC transporter permease [Nocardioides sp. HDW12B]QIK65710.1 ABC transporter permease [Nocardioides sp. HDW12B]
MSLPTAPADDPARATTSRPDGPVGPAGPTLDVSGTAPVTLARLVRVELRKMSDTRAGLWLLSIIGVITVLVIVAFFAVGESDDRTFLALLGFASIPQGVLLPVLGILLVTQEWGQRTAMVTFTLVPDRGRVLLAKCLAAVVLVLAGLALAALVALPLSLLGGSDAPFDGVTANVAASLLIGFLLGIVWGLAFGMVFLSSAVAIVLYFLVPTITSVVSGVWSSARDWLAWVDLGTSQGALFTEGGPSGEQWAQIATGSLVWIVLPGAVGIWRILRSEVK